MGEPVFEDVESISRSKHLINLPNSGLTAVLAGAGLTKGLCSHLPTWRELLVAIHTELNGNLPPNGDADNLGALALQLSWQHSDRRLTGNAPSEFQSAVAKYIEGRRQATVSQSLADSLTTFLATIKCRVIIDLNYDGLLRRILTEKSIQFVHKVGNEGGWVPVVPANGMLLWQIHGTIEYPTTIVLSPTEYRRAYMVNDLAAQLQKLGDQIENLWSIGVGLDKDDIWHYLCLSKRLKKIVSIWLDGRSKETLKSWREAVCAASASVTVVCSPNATSAVLASGLEDLKKKVEGLSRGLPGATIDRVAEFDLSYDRARSSSSWKLAIPAVLDEYRADYEAYYNSLRSQCVEGLAPRWSPRLENLEQADPEKLAADLARIVESAVKLARDSVQYKRGMLIGAAAQSAISYAIRLADVHGIPLFLDMAWPQHCELGAGYSVLVGANPFEVDAVGDRFNLMHFTTTERPIGIAWPLTGTQNGQVGQRAGVLLTEDEWEIAMGMLFAKGQPSLRIGQLQPINLSDLPFPPVFPWGFRFEEIGKFRKASYGATGTVSRYYQLVNTFVDGDRQVCKGGSLRDSRRRNFQLSFRGTIGPGEYDEFVPFENSELPLA